MSFTDPISDMITRIRNAQLRALNTVLIPNSKFRASILDVLKEEGYISDYKPSTDEKNTKTIGCSFTMSLECMYPPLLRLSKETGGAVEPINRPWSNVFALTWIMNIK